MQVADENTKSSRDALASAKPSGTSLKEKKSNNDVNESYTELGGFLYGTLENRYDINDEKSMLECVRNLPRVDREFRYLVEDAMTDRERGRNDVNGVKKINLNRALLESSETQVYCRHNRHSHVQARGEAERRLFRHHVRRIFYDKGD